MSTKQKTTILGFLIIIFFAIILLVISSNPFIINFDGSIHSWIANHQSPSIYGFMHSITKIGDNLETLIIFIVFGLFLFIREKKSFKIFTISCLSGIFITEALKYLVLRARPYNLIEHGPSFPSFHAMIATVFLCSSIILLVPLMKKTFSKNIFVLATSIIFPLVAFSRIYLSVHWMSDVITGIILGLICFISSYLVYCYKKENVL